MLDSMLYRNSYSNPTMREIFDDKTIIQNMLDIEAALADVEGELGMIPAEAAEEIIKKCKLEYMDIPHIEQGIIKMGHSLVPILHEIKDVCENNYGEYVHIGATTQDIIDTAFMMSIKRGLEVIYQDMLDIEQLMIDIAEKHKDTIMAGRSHTQQALPVTFGYKMANWASENHRNIQRMQACMDRCLVGSMFGAVGTMAGFGDKGFEVSSKTIEKLGLKVPDCAWHTSRDRIAEICNTLLMMAYTYGSIGNELAKLQMTEIAEVAEGFVKGSVGSSTMPHKRNPNTLESLSMLARLIKGEAGASIESMFCEHERDGSRWKVEWKAANETVILAGSSAARMKKVLSGLTVDPERMKQNLNILKGLMQSEPIMLALGEKIGNQTAHHVVYEVCMKTFEQRADFCEMLLKDETVAKYMTREEIEHILDPSGYTGLSSQIVDQVVANIRKDRESYVK